MPTRLRSLLLGLVCANLVFFGPAAARATETCPRPPTPIAIYDVVHGKIETTDCYSQVRRLGWETPAYTSHYCDEYSFQAVAGRSYIITMEASDFSSYFDSYLYLIRGTGILALDDDSGGGLNARIVYTPSTSGPITIHCTTYFAYAGGDYRLTLRLPGGPIDNGGFETGQPSPWRAGAGTELVTYTSYTGYYSAALLTSESVSSTYLYQELLYPGTYSPGQLSFWLWVVTDEPELFPARDRLYVRITNSSGAILTTLATFSNAHQGSHGYWTQVVLTIPRAYRVTGNRLRFSAMQDGSNPTIFLIDDVAIQ